MTEQEKQSIQSRLQKAFFVNRKDFYVHAPKQKGNVKAKLRYIRRYIRRPAIGLNRIEAYDGQMVTLNMSIKQMV